MDGEKRLLVYKDCVCLVLQLQIPDRLNPKLASVRLDHCSIVQTLKLFPDLRKSARTLCNRLVDACNLCDTEDMKTLQSFARGQTDSVVRLCAPKSFKNLCDELHFTSHTTDRGIGLYMNIKHRPYATVAIDLLMHNSERHLRAHMTYRDAMRYDRFVVQMSRLYRHTLNDDWFARFNLDEDARFHSQVEFMRSKRCFLKQLRLPTRVDDADWTECLVAFGRLYGEQLLRRVDMPSANALDDASFDAKVSATHLGEFAIAYMQIIPTNTKLNARQVATRWACNIILDQFIFEACDRNRLYRACQRASRSFARAVLAL